MKRVNPAAQHQPDSYEPASLDVAWTEYRDANPARNNPDGFAAFRAGYRRGISQGALLASSIVVHASSHSDTTTS
ncbi:hypothetical protein EV140_1938 [Microcella alkaliphila]|uniref:Uncharacterized protein n=1 Tax=Microcella alkaliphila TaxID=279828 RepID=A0A4Q7TGB8_9MICO|nr:hypothetical protein EV140_1938 [Microcella alkaliphila]